MTGPGRNLRVIISGGGTGGHIFPAVSIADELKRRNKDTEILFVGALGRMEMERVPDAGYKILGLPISGFQRRFTLKNLQVAWNAFRSVRLATAMIKEFSPDIAIGVGGYASGPLVRSAARLGIPTLLQEQNSYAGITNKILAKHAYKICVAYKNMERFFPAEKIVLTGNPVRAISISAAKKQEGYAYFSLKSNIPLLLVVGGSLGAGTINKAMLNGYDKLAKEKIQVIWQTGKYYIDDIKQKLKGKEHENIRIVDFVSRMDLAYNICDLMISRAGAISISEICLTGRAAILVPSPNVAEDHQTKNALALVEEKAALLVKDSEADDTLIELALNLIQDKQKLSAMAKNSKKLARPDSTSKIADEIYKILNIL
jgi:UDP-N-acetylglucosamine--N-acetylmuramyl-(pentapeptide) pyrophosphoryl-undecaprenol N-acetylglucosamine transferase